MVKQNQQVPHFRWGTWWSVSAVEHPVLLYHSKAQHLQANSKGCSPPKAPAQEDWSHTASGAHRWWRRPRRAGRAHRCLSLRLSQGRLPPGRQGKAMGRQKGPPTGCLAGDSKGAGRDTWSSSGRAGESATEGPEEGAIEGAPGGAVRRRAAAGSGQRRVDEERGSYRGQVHGTRGHTGACGPPEGRCGPVWDRSGPRPSPPPRTGGRRHRGVTGFQATGPAARRAPREL